MRIFVDGRLPGQPDPKFALAEERGRIAACGDRDDVLRLSDSSATIESLEGGVVVPGFHDAHMHLSAGGVALSQIDLGTCESEIAVVEHVSRVTRVLSQDVWVRGRGWDQTRWTPPEFPTRDLLDTFVPDHAVFLLRVDGHVAWLNTAGLKRIGIDRDTPDPPGGSIARHARSGEPTGILLERAVDQALDRLPPESDEERSAGVERGLERLRGYGITSIEDVAEPWAVPVYARLKEQGRLTARVSVWLPLDTDEKEADALRARHAGDAPDLTVATRKVFLDGTLGSRTAALSEGYADAVAERGTLRVDEAGLVETVGRADSRGWAVAFHAIGDAAVRMALDVISTLETRDRPRPHRVEHAVLVAPADLPRFARLGVAVSVQPVQLDTDRGWLERRLGEVRAARAYGFRSLLESGATVAMGTDWPVESPDPMQGIAAAARSRGFPTGGEEITVAEAIDAYTRGSARAAGEEGTRGALRPGALADFAVLSDDPGWVPVEELVSRVRVIQTVVGGRTVFREGEV